MDASDRRKRASEEAAAWWVRLQTEGLPRAEREQFVDWLRESSVHVAEMLRVAKVHGALEQFQRWADISTDGSDADNVVSLSESSPVISCKDSKSTRPLPPARFSFRQRLRLPVLAVSCSAIMIAAWLWIGLRGETIQTERGERREVALTDGSVVEVDPETRLRVRFEGQTRRVLLERGRALFRVAKNAARPFLVQADGTTVRAVGTAFGVERQKGGVVVTVAEGKVAVFQTGAAHLLANPGDSSSTLQKRGTGTGTSPGFQPASPSDGAGRGLRKSSTQPPAEVLLTAGQQVTVQPSGTAERVRTVDSERQLAWARGRLDFDNETVAVAVQEFNRYNRVQLNVTDEALAKRPVSGVFDASDPESFVAFIQTVVPVRVTRNDSADVSIAMASTSKASQ
jgi:transmembrane sensor